MSISRLSHSYPISNAQRLGVKARLTPEQVAEELARIKELLDNHTFGTVTEKVLPETDPPVRDIGKKTRERIQAAQKWLRDRKNEETLREGLPIVSSTPSDVWVDGEMVPKPNPVNKSKKFVPPKIKKTKS